MPHSAFEELIRNLDGNLKTILFDLDGTLRYSHPAPDQAMYDYAASLGVEDDDEKRKLAARWAHYYWAESPELKEDIRTYPERGDDFWLNYVHRSLLAFGCTGECATNLAGEIHVFMRDRYQPEDRLSPGAIETLAILKEAGYRLGLLSNRHEPCGEYLQQLGVGDFFDLVLVAGEVQSWKPNPELFLAALARLGADSSQSLYVGDNYYADIVGSRRAGVTPLLYDPQAVFENVDCAVIRTLEEMQLLASLV